MTTAHHFSVIANSCVKPPVNPDTGLSVTLHERSTHGKLDEYPQDCDNQVQNDKINNYNMNGMDTVEHYVEIHGSTTGLGQTDPMIEGVTSDLDNLTDDAFYKRLIELKNEHKKTLSLCESLYTEKVNAQTSSNINDNMKNNAATTTMNTIGQAWASESTNHRVAESLNNTYNAIGRSLGSSAQDRVKDMSKPPSGTSRPQTVTSTAMCSQAFMAQVRSYSDGEEDDEYWKPISAVTTDAELSRDESHDSSCPVYQQQHDASKHSTMCHIDDMWEHFSVEEYAPTRAHQGASSPTRASAKNQTISRSVDIEDWRHRITQPKPFNMSLRESAKIKEKSQTLLDYEQKREKERKTIDDECQKKFKAKPVPAHVYMPLFDEKMEEMESRRKFIRENSKDVLKSIEKPFNFMKREEERKKHRHTNTKDAANAEIKQKMPTGFKARPFPAHIFDDTVMDRLQEEEEYRKIRVQMRAEELLKTSSLPPNMAAMGKEYTEGKFRQSIRAERAKQAGITAEHKFQPKINDTLPDFEEKHRQMQRDLCQKRRAKEATVCKPFNLRTDRIASKRHQVYEDIARDAERLKRNTWAFKNSARLSRMRALSASMDAIPTKATTSSELRASANRTKMQHEVETQLSELERERQQRLKEKKIKKYIAERVAINDNSKDLEQSLKCKIKQHKRSEKERKAEYLQMLNEIEERIEKRPLLFERALQANAKRAAEKKYQATLQRAGLNSEYITSQGKDATDADFDAVSEDEEYMVSHVNSVRNSVRSSYREHSQSHSESRGSSFEYEEANETSEGSDIERD